MGTAAWETVSLLCAAPVPTGSMAPKGSPGTQGSNCVMLWDITLGSTDATF